MSLLKYIRSLKGKSTAATAKERLQIIIAHERAQQTQLDYMPKLQEEILEVVAKYIQIDREKVSIQIDRDGENAILELNVTMPDEVLA